MSEAIAVLNAGSSSIKFSLFGGADLELVVRGQAEAIHTAPRFVAKDPAGATVSTRAWGEGSQLGHDGALQHIVEFVREQLGDTQARRHRPPGRARRDSSTPSRCASTRAALKDLGAVRSARAAAPAAQPDADPAPARAPARAAPGRLLRHGVPSRPAGARADVRPSQGAARRRRAALRLPRPVVRVHRLGPAAARPEGGERPLRGPAPRQRREHVRAVRRPQRRQHDGLHRGRRAADGHPLRRPRSRRHPVPDGPARHGRARDREADLQRVRACSASPACRATCARCWRATRRERGSRSSSTSIASGASWARWPRRWAAWTRSSSPAGSARTAPRSGERVCRDARWLGVKLDEQANRDGGPQHQPGDGLGRGLGRADQRRTDDRPAHAARAASVAAEHRDDCKSAASRRPLPGQSESEHVEDPTAKPGKTADLQPWVPSAST